MSKYKPTFVLSEEQARKMFQPPAPRPLSHFKWEGDEWYDKHRWSPTINAVIDEMQAFNDKYPDHAFIIHQIKEKFGTLRFYYKGADINDLPEEAKDQYTDAIMAIRHVVSNSTFLCLGEGCESIKGEAVPNRHGWLTVLCKQCQDKERQHID